MTAAYVRHHRPRAWAEFMLDQWLKLSKRSKSVRDEIIGKISCWSSQLLTAEAKKADGASETAVQIPSPPSLIGKHACSHWLPDNSTFRMVSSPDFRMPSNSINLELSKHLDVRSMCSNFGTPKEFSRWLVHSESQFARCVSPLIPTLCISHWAYRRDNGQPSKENRADKHHKRQLVWNHLEPDI